MSLIALRNLVLGIWVVVTGVQVLGKSMNVFKHLDPYRVSRDCTGLARRWSVWQLIRLMYGPRCNGPGHWRRLYRGQKLCQGYKGIMLVFMQAFTLFIL